MNPVLHHLLRPTPERDENQTDMSQENCEASVTAIIKTFERPKCLDRLVRSIRKFYPKLSILIADDSFTPSPRDDAGYFRLGPDVGASAGRNALLDRVETPNFLLLDDDFEFTEHTDLNRLLAILGEEKVPLVAGECIWCKHLLMRIKRKRSSWYGNFQLKHGHLRMLSEYHHEEDGYVVCDFVQNFFMARTEAVRGMGAWDAELKTNEHEEFFFRFWQQGLQCGFCPGGLGFALALTSARLSEISVSRLSRAGCREDGCQPMD